MQVNVFRDIAGNIHLMDVSYTPPQSWKHLGMTPIVLLDAFGSEKPDLRFETSEERRDRQRAQGGK